MKTNPSPGRSPGKKSFRPPAAKNERGMLLIVLLLIALLIASAYAAIYSIQLSRHAKKKEIEERRKTGEGCRKAMQKVVEAMEVERMLRGEYPYHFNDDFMDQYKNIDRCVYNKEIWNPGAGAELELNTSFGESYELTGWCNDGYIYSYDSQEGMLPPEKYDRKELRKNIE